jgi:glycosyltransferase involved in cell wall biosynthesis
LPHKGQREAVWSLDILHYLFPNLHLILVGDGPERQETQRFASLIGVTAECHFVGSVLDTGPYYQRADLVWITGRGEGINTMLEAMAAGKAIVAARHPLRADVLVDGKTGLFAAPGDKADLCRLTRMLLDQPERRLELGQAAQQHAAEKFAVPRFVAQTMALYQGVSLVG